MKLEQLLVQYLYTNKKVSIQDIGTFTLSPDVIIPAENEKDPVLPENAIHFEFNGREQKDEGLIDYIVAQSKKLKSLASSDLESYSLLSRQFLNIGKPMVIEGIGTLLKNQEGTYDFQQGALVNQKLKPASQYGQVKDNKPEEISFTTPARPNGFGKPAVLGLLALLLLCAAAAIYYFGFYDKDNTATETENVSVTPAGTTDTLQTQQPDSSNIPAVSTAVPKARDSFSFRVVLKEYPNKAAADKAFDRLTNYGHKLQVAAKDSSTYTLAMPFTTPLSDTLRARDSLRKFFGGNPYIVL